MRFIILLFLFLFSSIAYAGQYDGEWNGIQSCGDRLKIKIEINDNRAFSDPQPYPAYPDPRYTLRGKVYGKNKLGLNSGFGNTQGKFISENELILNPKNNCQFTLTKNIPEKKLIYCVNDAGVADFYTSGSCFTSQREITKLEFDNYNIFQ